MGTKAQGTGSIIWLRANKLPTAHIQVKALIGRSPNMDLLVMQLSKYT